MKRITGTITFLGIPIYGLVEVAQVEAWMRITVGLITAIAGIQYIVYNWRNRGNVCANAHRCANRSFKKFSMKT